MQVQMDNQAKEVAILNQDHQDVRISFLIKIIL